MCQSLTGLTCLHVLYHFVPPTILSNNHFHDLDLKTEERKYTEGRKSHLRSYMQDPN